MEHKSHKEKWQQIRMGRLARARNWRALNAMLRYFATSPKVKYYITK